MNDALISEVAGIIKELFNFDGQIEELCGMSEMEGEFHLTGSEMLAKLHTFVDAYAD